MTAPIAAETYPDLMTSGWDAEPCETLANFPTSDGSRSGFAQKALVGQQAMAAPSPLTEDTLQRIPI